MIKQETVGIVTQGTKYDIHMKTKISGFILVPVDTIKLHVKDFGEARANIGRFGASASTFISLLIATVTSGGVEPIFGVDQKLIQGALCSATIVSFLALCWFGFKSYKQRNVLDINNVISRIADDDSSGEGVFMDIPCKTST